MTVCMTECTAWYTTVWVYCTEYDGVNGGCMTVCMTECTAWYTTVWVYCTEYDGVDGTVYDGVYDRVYCMVYDSLGVLHRVRRSGWDGV